MTDLNELDRLLREATAGPWMQEDFNNLITSGAGANWLLVATMATNTYRDQGRHNADLVVALRNCAEELIRDARRYRWLRGDGAADYSKRWTQWEVRCWQAPQWTLDLRRSELDAALDDAIAQEQS